ncbi:MAG TPA: triphosphoribosyl-dephospho-CoA synthase [Planctomycetaceae bacterium]|nr:triphosphoribosyl-dephospho-CoA synthase [Planctomycetaceae bacterium]
MIVRVPPDSPTPAMGPDVSLMIRAACALEAKARKPGNVHPEAAFADSSYADFVASAEAIAPILAAAPELRAGRAIFEAVCATRERCGRNTNLGIVLLMAPLAMVPRETRLADGISDVLLQLTREDADLVYQAIRLAQPAGLGQVEAQDVSRPPTATLLEVMRLASDRDLIARQYAENFSLVLELGLPLLSRVADFEQNWEKAIVELQLEMMARYPDSLIARKCGADTAREASHQARAVLNAIRAVSSSAHDDLRRFDDWLRSDGNRRNPGTTADLIAASLFAAFRDGTVAIPQAALDREN